MSISGTKKEIKEALPLIEDNFTFLHVTAFEANRKNRFFSKYLDLVAKKVIRISNEERSACES